MSRPRYMLDTNICIYLMRRQPPEVARRFAELVFGDVVMSVITLAELKCGIRDPGDDRSRVADIIRRLLNFVPALTFDESAADRYAELHRAMPQRRRDAMDRLIAAHAIAADCVLVTHNEADFHAYPGLKWENWVQAVSHESSQVNP